VNRPLLEARDLTLTLSGREIFSIERLALDRGETLAIVGPNGAGKSSLLNTLALLQAPSSGRVFIDGQAAANGNTIKLRRRMAVVFQDPMLLDFSVGQNVTLALRIRGIAKKEAAVRAEHWMRRFGVNHLAQQAARSLSGGEAQRTSLARAFALEPELLMLDEPFGALDYPTRKALLQELSAILEEMKTTTLFVTHEFSEIPHLTERVAVLHNGRIIRDGSFREVFGDSLNLNLHLPWDS
jgi:tungstate transport system ATP-binding protein